MADAPTLDYRSPPPDARTRFAAWPLAVAVVVWAEATLVLAVGRQFERVFADFGIGVPRVTAAALALGRLWATWYGAALALLLLAAVGVALGFAADPLDRRRAYLVPLVWINAATVALAVLAFVAYGLPYVSIYESVQGS